MSTKLTQKKFFKGVRDFEIVDEQINVRIKSYFKEETFSVMLAVLDPEPVITRSYLEFVSRVNGETLVSLELSRPNVEAFNDFVNTLKQRAQAEYNTFSGINVAASSALADDNEQEPPDFNERSLEEIAQGKTIDVAGIENAINMLKTYVDNEEIQPLIIALESLKQAPQDRARLIKVATVFNELGSSQGAVLTYAPYISVMLSDGL